MTIWQLILSLFALAVTIRLAVALWRGDEPTGAALVEWAIAITLCVAAWIGGGA